MPNGRLIVALAGVVALARVSVAADPAGPPRDLNPVFAEVLKSRLNHPAFFGAMVDDGHLRAVGVAGIRKKGDPTPVTQNDSVRIGRATKPMTAALVGVLIDAGKLKFETTLGELFSEPQAQARPDMAGVTIAQLLCDGAGLPGDSDIPWDRFKLTNQSPSAQRYIALQKVLATPRLAVPRDAEYDDSIGYVVLGAVIERVTGQTWEQAMQDLVFKPLGMTTAGFGPPGEAGKVDQPWGHFTKLGMVLPTQLDRPPVTWPADGVHCSITDWARFVAQFAGRGSLDGKPALLSDDTRIALLRPNPLHTAAGGWLMFDSGQQGRIYAAFGRTGYWVSFARVMPRIGYAVVVSTNSGDESLNPNGDQTAMIDALTAMEKFRPNSVP